MILFKALDYYLLFIDNHFDQKYKVPKTFRTHD